MKALILLPLLAAITLGSYAMVQTTSEMIFFAFTKRKHIVEVK